MRWLRPSLNLAQILPGNVAVNNIVLAILTTGPRP